MAPARRPCTPKKRLGDARLAKTAALLMAGWNERAYYLAGYAVEWALKACICARQWPDQFPPTVAVVRDRSSHDRSRLLALAGLDAVLAGSADGTLKANWGIARDWSEGSRCAFAGQADAQELSTAVTAPAHGVLPWRRRCW